MPSPRQHLTDEQLTRFQDGDLEASISQHLENCPECSGRLRDIRATESLYREYHDSIRAPLLPAAPKPWLRLDQLLDRQETARRPRFTRWWLVPALAAVLGAVAFVVLYRPSNVETGKADRLLAESARTELPGGRRVSMRVHGRLLIHDAPESAHLRAVFAAADYSWDDPLSARSYQSWRRHLRHKRDSVNVSGGSYVVRTETEEGILHLASLTLRVSDLRPTSGLLRFQGEGDVELAEAAPETVTPSLSVTPPVKPPAAETPAQPEDLLRVLEALNRIGADAGEPIEVSMDTEHGRVAVRADGLGPKRQQEIAQALEGLPRVIVDFHAAVRRTGGTSTTPPEKYTTSMPPALRRRLEEIFGGPIGLQQTTDEVLEDSGAVLARAHAIEALAANFPAPVEAALKIPDRERLNGLRQTHVTALRELTAKIKGVLRSLLSESAGSQRAGVAAEPWQAGASSLAVAARELDRALNRLLAGSYSEPAGQEMLRVLGVQFDGLESAIRSQTAPGR